MTSELLQKARDFEAEAMKQISPKERPVYHLTGGCGWINDPNGLSFYKGEYHLFYQYHPYSNEWGPMHWGHVKSKDLLNWERLPVAMAPDKDYDGAGCFSGSALELKDGRHLLMYTGVQKFPETGEERQTQCIAFGDGVTYEKYEGNPVITPDMIPQGGRPSDFRDPKIWQEEDGTFYAVMANMREDGNGQAVLFKSADALKWEYVTMLDESSGKIGKMWECPDFFELDGKQVLMLSPMAMEPEDGIFHVGHGTVVIAGTYDKQNCRFEREYVQPIDQGIDFYAPQTMLTPDGRRVMLSWMQAWSNSKHVPDGAKYFGQMNVPRELSLRDGQLFQNPVRELKSYRGTPVKYEKVSISDEMVLDGIDGRVIDMTVTIRNMADFEEFVMKLAADDKHYTSVTFDPKKGTVTMDRSHCGYLMDITHKREIPLLTNGEELKLRFIMDRFSVEMFINDGEQAVSMTIYTAQEADCISFKAEGTAEISVEKYALEF